MHYTSTGKLSVCRKISNSSIHPSRSELQTATTLLERIRLQKISILRSRRHRHNLGKTKKKRFFSSRNKKKIAVSYFVPLLLIARHLPILPFVLLKTGGTWTTWAFQITNKQNGSTHQNQWGIHNLRIKLATRWSNRQVQTTLEILYYYSFYLLSLRIKKIFFFQWFKRNWRMRERLASFPWVNTS